MQMPRDGQCASLATKKVMNCCNSGRSQPLENVKKKKMEVSYSQLGIIDHETTATFFLVERASHFYVDTEEV